MSTATSELVDLVARRLVQAHYPGDTHDRWSGLAELTKGAYRKQAEYVIAAGFVLPLEQTCTLPATALEKTMPDPNLLTPAQMLTTLHEHGRAADSDFNDGEDVQGWFGWSVRDGVLTVTHMVEPAESETGDVRPRAAASWRLVSIDDEVSS